jgi:hypothetical protein
MRLDAVTKVATMALAAVAKRGSLLLAFSIIGGLVFPPVAHELRSVVPLTEAVSAASPSISRSCQATPIRESRCSSVSTKFLFTSVPSSPRRSIGASANPCCRPALDAFSDTWQATTVG